MRHGSRSRRSKTGPMHKASDHASLNACSPLLVVHRQARSAAVVKRLRERLLDRLWSFRLGAPGPVEPAEVAAFQQASRELFQDNQRLAGAHPPDSIDSAPSPVDHPHPPPAVPDTAAASEPPIKSITPIPGSTVSSREFAVEERLRERNPQVGDETAPDSLLKIPTIVTPVADDFFAGLIRGAEGGDR